MAGKSPKFGEVAHDQKAIELMDSIPDDNDDEPADADKALARFRSISRDFATVHSGFIATLTNGRKGNA